VTAAAGCAWTASTTNTWIHTSSSGSGNGTASYSLDANTSSISRTGGLNVDGQALVIVQAGAACTYSLSMTNVSFSAPATNGSLAVTVVSGCPWTASSTHSWIHTTSSASGNGTITYTVDANTSSIPRTGAIFADSQTLTINQAGVACTYSLSATSASYSASGSNDSVNITALGGCARTDSTTNS